jgi:hypothetical protein
MTDNTNETLLAALGAGWEGNPSDLVDEEWCWVTDARHPDTAAKGRPTLSTAAIARRSTRTRRISGQSARTTRSSSGARTANDADRRPTPEPETGCLVIGRVLDE